MTTQQYIDSLNQRYKLGNATEHTFRGDLAQLIETIAPEVVATNEPKRQKCGAPDYILTRKDIPVGYIEAKDIGDSDLDGSRKTGNKEQFDRYKESLENLIFTDYLRFHLYRNGQFITSIAIGEVNNGKILALPENFAQFENLIRDFSIHIAQTIKSPKKLAEMMAGKARLLAEIIANALISDEDNSQNSTLKEQMQAFKEILIHDITPRSFADVYAQTIAYGMFAARLHDPTLPTFSRQEAAELIPKTNPFLRKLFGYIAGPDLDDRIKWVVDSLVDVFLACNVEEILKDYGKATKMENPIIHFYETFLSEYDPKVRKARGVWYTPAPVVNFIVRAVDDVLKTEFALPQGLADTSQTKIQLSTQHYNTKKQQYETVEKEVHKVQILDPATGTGTFLAEVIKHIHQRFAGQEGIWSNYVEKHLIPRLNGFELLMASYAMAHLQLDLLLKDTGYKATTDERLRVYLTNSLEESHPDTNTLFASWLSDEANEANRIKRDTPVMVILGNPPYSVSSTNKGEWIQNLISDYKKNLNEKKINLDDDYIKFIRYGQHFIDKNGSGILAYISNNSFIDGVTHRQMRKNLLETFDKIYILDLHGNSRKLETSPDGSIDQNVFDIMAGVSINIFIKTKEKKANELGRVFHYDLYGRRDYKYAFLSNTQFSEVAWNELFFQKPTFFFVPKDFQNIENYNSGFKLDEVFPFNNSGFETAKDSFIIKFSKQHIEKLQSEIVNLSGTELSSKFGLKISKINEVKNDIENSTIIKTLYRPFDDRYTLISKNSGGVMFRPRFETVRHLLKENVALLCCKRQTSFDFQHSFITKLPVERCFVSLQTGEVSYAFPLYLYPEETEQQTTTEQTRTPNLDLKIVEKIASGLGLRFVPDHESEEAGQAGTFTPLDLLDYIYAVLHSPTYRETYKEFLKIDFPRVPYPKNTDDFWKLVKLGGELRGIHLLESPKVQQFITTYPKGGDNKITKKITKTSPGFIPDENNPEIGKVWINDTQYFDNVPLIAWEFYIGGYQPAQKWLKDRRDRTLSFEDILHYQKIIVALLETDRIMQEIDEVGVVGEINNNLEE